MLEDCAGKGFYLWKIWLTEGGDPNAIAQACADAELSHVIIKIADGSVPYNVIDDIDLVPPLVVALRLRGISPWGFQYAYGGPVAIQPSNTPAKEANTAVARVNELGLDAFVIDAEGEYKAWSDRWTRATQYMNILRPGLAVPILLASYRYPSLHPQLPWDEFREKCDGDLPQVYWVLSTNPAFQLQKSFDEFKAMEPVLPYLATGSAYSEGSWAATPGQVVEFMDKAKALGISHVNFWEMRNTRANLPSVWSAIAEYQYVEEEPVPESIVVFYEAKSTGAVIFRTADFVRVGLVHPGGVIIGNGESMPDKPANLIVRPGDVYVPASQVSVIQI